MGDRLAGKVAIVTKVGSIGKGWGNGKAAAALFAQEGVRIMAVDINAAVEEIAEIMTSEGGECAVCECDVPNSDQVEPMVSACADTMGELTFFITTSALPSLAVR